MKHFDVLHPDLEVFGFKFLEASAGTGKTFAIEHLICRFLIDENQPLNVEQILVVTFTRAATREMKQRIYSNLLKVQEILQTRDPTPWPYIQVILNGKEEGIQRALRKIENALIHFDLAQIYTIHGFCFRMLQQFALTAKVGFSFSDPDNIDKSSLLEEELFSFLRKSAWPEYSLSQLSQVWQKERGDPRQLLRSLKRFLEKDTPPKESSSFAQGYDSFQKKIEKLGSLKSFEQSKIIEDFQVLELCYKRMQNTNYYDQVSLIGKCLEEKKCSEADFAELLDKDIFLEKLSDDNLKVRAKISRDNLHYPEIFPLLRKEVYPLLRNASDPQINFMRLGKDFQEIWEKKKQSSDIFTHDDLLKKTEEATNNALFLQEVRKLYEAVIVDEFQDTDRRQWAIFEKIFLQGQTRTVYFIGDPKQSIYSFRKADLYTYLRARQLVGADRRAFLATNYRSMPSLVQALNVLFAKEHVGDWIRLPYQKSFLEYVPVKARPLATDQDFSDGRGSIHFVIGEETLGREKNWPTKALEENVFFPYFAEETLHLQSKGISPPEIAFLVKDRFQAQRLFDFFQRKGIRSSVKRTANLQDSPAFEALYDFLYALWDYNDKSALKRVLTGPFYAFSEEELLGFSEEMPQLRAFYLELYQVLEEKGLGIALESFFSSKGRERSISSEMLEKEGVCFYREVEQIVHLLVACQAGTGANLLQLLLFLEEKKYRESEEEEWKVRQIEDQKAVTIMTIHSSKGLEFDVVFALGLMYRSTKVEDLMVIQQDGKEFLKQMDMADEDSRKALCEVESEKMRQLYVALTRPRRRLYLPLALELQGKTASFGMAAPMELFLSRFFDKEAEEERLYELLPELSLGGLAAHLDKLQLQASITYLLLEKKKIEAQKIEPVHVEQILPHRSFSVPFSSKLVVSYSALSNAQGVDLFEKKPGSLEAMEEKNMQNLPRGIKTGVVFHAILEKIFQRRLYRPFAEEKIRQLVDEKLFGTEIEPWAEAIAISINKLFELRCEVNGESLQLLNLDEKKMQVEMEFLYPYEQKLYKGSIDLAFEWNGKYYFADWKSNNLGDSVSLEDVMKKNDYFLQASIYAEGLQRYVALFDKRPFKDCFGGCFYFFLRDTKAYHFYPKLMNLHLEDVYANI